ncbi:hypothetical protein HPB48_005411 [Haemaphysalis longicornis]|uniref:Ran-GTPase activating protein 1 C-terminal domain-containing protein n=1 Tax=Haemaphysalis longicornis TaxID=44386 RepID=A0A9J6G6W2_HAELO|nr:hypothetical protein HPB48_005411 [Haemaphysalis longicornis]
MAAQNIGQLAEHLAHSASITDSREVSFRDKGLKLDNESDASKVVQAIARCPQLETLCLEGNTLGQDAAKAIGKALEGRPSLKRALWKDMFTGRLKSEIPDAIVQLLAKALTTCLVESTKAGKPLALRTFICGRNRLENVGATAMGAVFGKMHSLEEVAMPQNGIYHEGIAAVAKGLMSNKNLRILNLNDNTFTLKGATKMAQALKHLEHLESINFGDCLIKTPGAIAIAQALKEGHNELKAMNLGYNELTLEGGCAVVEAVKDKPLLELLELDGNKFGAEGSGETGVTDGRRGKAGQALRFQEFLSGPTAAKLAQLGSEGPQNLVNLVKASAASGNDLVRAYVASVLGGSAEEPAEVKQLAVESGNALLSAAFDLASKENQITWLTNELVVHLGLLKGEKDQKVSWPETTRDGALILMADLARREYFSVSARQTLQCFLAKPLQLHTSSGVGAKARHRLMQVLYQA